MWIYPSRQTSHVINYPLHINTDHHAEHPSTGPGYHGCGSIKGKRENFPKRKEKKRKGGISWLTSTLSIGKIFRKSPQNILIVIPLFHNTSEGEK